MYLLKDLALDSISRKHITQKIGYLPTCATYLLKHLALEDCFAAETKKLCSCLSGVCRSKGKQTKYTKQLPSKYNKHVPTYRNHLPCSLAASSLRKIALKLRLGLSGVCRSKGKQEHYTKKVPSKQNKHVPTYRNHLPCSLFATSLRRLALQLRPQSCGLACLGCDIQCLTLQAWIGPDSGIPLNPWIGVNYIDNPILDLSLRAN